MGVLGVSGNSVVEFDWVLNTPVFTTGSGGCRISFGLLSLIVASFVMRGIWVLLGIVVYTIVTMWVIWGDIAGFCLHLFLVICNLYGTFVSIRRYLGCIYVTSDYICNMDSKELIKVIEAVREKSGMSMDDVAKKMGISRQQYWRVVNEKSPLTVDFVFLALCESGYMWFVGKNIFEFKGIGKQ